MAKAQLADVMGRMMTEAQKTYGSDTCYVAPDHAATHYGVPVGNLALEYLLCSNVIPMERMIELSGPKGSGKSALGYDLTKRVLGSGGVGVLVETENKSSAPLLLSLVGEKAEYLRMHRVKNMDQAQERMTSEFALYKKVVPDKSVPFSIMLDSLVGSKAEESVKNINKEGSADRAFPKEALMISSYMGTMADKLIGWPALFIFTNHEKQATNTTGHGPKTRNPGGSAPDFHATYHVRVTKIATSASKLEPGFTVKLKTKKCAMGPDGRSIVVDMGWKFSQVDGKVSQDTWFDWDKATAELLAGDEVPRTAVKDIVQVTKVTNTKYNCTTLGMSGVHPREIGAAIHSDKDMVAKLRAVLGIFTWREL